MVCAKTDVNFRNKAGSTPLHFAALQAHPNMVELLLTHSSIDTVSLVTANFYNILLRSTAKIAYCEGVRGKKMEWSLCINMESS